MSEWSGYANRESFTFEVWAGNNEPLYRAIVEYGADCLRRVPNMTDQTLGANIKLAVRGWVDDADNGRPIRNYGWGPEGVLDIPAKVLREMADDIGRDRWGWISEEDVAESFREVIEEEVRAATEGNDD